MKQLLINIADLQDFNRNELIAALPSGTKIVTKYDEDNNPISLRVKYPQDLEENDIRSIITSFQPVQNEAAFELSCKAEKKELDLRKLLKRIKKIEKHLGLKDE